MTTGWVKPTCGWIWSAWSGRLDGCRSGRAARELNHRGGTSWRAAAASRLGDRCRLSSAVVGLPSGTRTPVTVAVLRGRLWSVYCTVLWLVAGAFVRPRWSAGRPATVGFRCATSGGRTPWRLPTSVERPWHRAAPGRRTPSGSWPSDGAEQRCGRPALPAGLARLVVGEVGVRWMTEGPRPVQLEASVNWTGRRAGAVGGRASVMV